MTKNEVIIFGLSAVLSCVCAYALTMKSKIDKVADRLDSTIDELANDDLLDIKQVVNDSLITQTIERTITNEVRKRVYSAYDDIRRDANNKIEAEVKTKVNAVCADLKPEIKKQLERQVAKVDISELRQEIVTEAQETARAKFKEDLDDILDKHNEELEAVSKIYSSIAKKFEKEA